MQSWNIFALAKASEQLRDPSLEPRTPASRKNPTAMAKRRGDPSREPRTSRQPLTAMAKEGKVSPRGATSDPGDFTSTSTSHCDVRIIVMADGRERDVGQQDADNKIATTGPKHSS